jgi:predicted PurR-regulated permease PerM
VEPRDEPPPATSRLDDGLVDRLVLLGLVGLLVVLAFRLFSPLFPSILWGGLLAIICAHPYERLVGRIGGRRSVGDIVFGAFLALALLLPVLLFAWEATARLPVIIAYFKGLNSADTPDLPMWLLNLPLLGDIIAEAWAAASEDFAGLVKQLAGHAGGVASWLFERIGSLGAFVLEFVLGIVISVFFLHYRFPIRAFLARFFTRVGGEFANDVVLGAFETTRQAFAGVIAAAIAQTLLSTLALIVAGVPGVPILAALTFVLALIQVGPLFVLIIAAGLLLSEGDTTTVFFLAVWFLGVVMSVDNLVRPYFTSHGTGLPWILAFLGTIGGLFAWGLIGVFVGPVLASVLLRILVNWVEAGDEADRIAGG